MLTGFHGIVVDVTDFDSAVRDHALLFGRAPVSVTGEAAPGVRSARFVLANSELELRDLGTVALCAAAEQAASSFPGTPGIAGLRLSFRPDPGVHRLSGWLEGPTIPIELVAAVGPSGGSAAPGISRSVLSEIDPDAQIAGLDHVVIVSTQPERIRRYFVEELGIRLALDRSFPERGLRLLFFRLGGVTLEVASPLAENPAGPARDGFQGLAWKVTRIEAIQARLRAAGFDVSEIRSGHKAGTRVATVRRPVHGIPTLLIEHPPRDEGALPG